MQTNMSEIRVLILGASGMLGSALIRILSENQDWDIFGTVRSKEVKKFFLPEIAERLVVGYDVTKQADLLEIFNLTRPDVVVNCISLNKKLLKSADPLLIIPIYSLLPHQLAQICKKNGARLIHISTDGVFSGRKGTYTEEDFPDAKDIYGSAKYVGEVHERHTIDIRTSIIGHELQSANGLLEWFLSQKDKCTCFNRAIFSGLPTIVLAQIIRDIVIPHVGLSGVYHIAAKPISKCNLLKLIAKAYGKEIEITPDDKVEIDLSLNSDRFKLATGYSTPEWSRLIDIMHSYQ